MSRHIGEIFPGRVSGVTAYGIYIELDNTVEGFLPIESLRDDRYNYREEQYCLVGNRSGRKIRLGDEIQARLISADKNIPKIEFFGINIPKKQNI